MSGGFVFPVPVMGRPKPLYSPNTVKLDNQGDGNLNFSPDNRVTWYCALLSLIIPGAVNTPTFTVYMGGAKNDTLSAYFLDQQTSKFAVFDRVACRPLLDSEWIVVQITGADALAQVHGSVRGVFTD